MPLEIKCPVTYAFRGEEGSQSFPRFSGWPRAQVRSKTHHYFPGRERGCHLQQKNWHVQEKAGSVGNEMREEGGVSQAEPGARQPRSSPHHLLGCAQQAGKDHSFSQGCGADANQPATSLLDVEHGVSWMLEVDARPQTYCVSQQEAAWEDGPFQVVRGRMNSARLGTEGWLMPDLG